MEEKTTPKLLVSRKEASQQLKSQIEKGTILRDREINSETELQQAIEDCQNWSQNNKELLSKLFDTPSTAKEYGAFSHYTHVSLDTSEINREKHKHVQFMINIEAYRVWVGNHINHLNNILTQYGINDMPLDTSEQIFGDKIFIVHGHDEAAKQKMARFVESLELPPIILDEQPSRGQTIIDKFEEYAVEAGFAIVLLTSDDVGAIKEKLDNPEPRARQNVILELGYFLCGLGRERVRILYEEGVELPSDIYGLSYVQMDRHGGWKLEMAKEMASVGIPIDLNKLVQKK